MSFESSPVSAPDSELWAIRWALVRLAADLGLVGIAIDIMSNAGPDVYNNRHAGQIIFKSPDLDTGRAGLTLEPSIRLGQVGRAHVRDE